MIVSDETLPDKKSCRHRYAQLRGCMFNTEHFCLSDDGDVGPPEDSRSPHDIGYPNDVGEPGVLDSRSAGWSLDDDDRERRRYFASFVGQ